MSLTSLLKNGFQEYEILSWQIFFFFQYFKNIIPLSPGLHCFWNCPMYFLYLFFECHMYPLFPSLDAFKIFSSPLVNLLLGCRFLRVCVCVCARLCLKFIEFLGSVNLVFNKFGKSLDIIYIFFCSSSSRISSLLLDSNYTYIRPYIIFCYYSQFLRYGWIQPEISRCCCFQRVCSCWS